MAQFARPNLDASIGTWTDQAGGVLTIYTTIDESVFDDADFVQSVSAPANAPVVFKLGSVTDPEVSTGHVLRYRYRKNTAAGSQIDLTIQLRQGYISEGIQGTLIASATHTNVSETFTAGTLTLSGAEADAITNYADLFVRIVANQV